ncbi:GNAT family N-acetyltransferase [Metabacillus iocasae]|uniref:ElaA protein n=1 Tax=Priestia iocasae TaxID=2291674 RepID=A0ABS2QW25_9BACI|nr:GNAT family N-acetyltransferase [Metabacillus iocasae]MBM7702679.1 ElaA protein [Metabacillus iocasae]
MSWVIKQFDELTLRELYAILQARTNVFVVEQNCPYNEVDGKDIPSYHVFKKEKEEIVAYLRVLPKGVSYSEASLGRIIVHPSYRRTGLGQELVSRGLAFLHEELNETTVKIQAQSYLQDFYESFGFKQISKEYLEDGIPHIDMLLKKE